MSTASTFPARWALICAENSDIKRPFELKPSKAIPHTDLPASYCTPGPLQGPMAVKSHEYGLVRRWQLTILIQPALQGQDVASLGGESLITAVSLLDWLPGYFVQHPRLQTDSLANLTGCRGVVYTDSGAAVIVGPGGGRYLGIVALLDVFMTDLVDSVEA